MLSDDLDHKIAQEQLQRRRLSRLVDALPVLAGFVSPDGHILHSISLNQQSFIWEMPEFSYSHDSVTTVIDLCDRAGRGERLQLERPYCRSQEDNNDNVELRRGLLTFDPMFDEDGNVSEIAVSLIDCEDHGIPPLKPQERSRSAIANMRVQSVLSFAQMVIETLWDGAQDTSETPDDGPISEAEEKTRRQRMSRCLDTIASIIDPISDPDLDTVPLEVIIDCVLSIQPSPELRNRLRILMPDADIPIDYVPLLALMIGELMANARAYGPWRHDDHCVGDAVALGHICVEADLFDGPGGPHLRIDWTEDGVAKIAPFEGPGFGLTLCERLFPQITSGSATMTSFNDGISWTFELPVSDPSETAQGFTSKAFLVHSNLQMSDLPPDSDPGPA